MSRIAVQGTYASTSQYQHILFYQAVFPELPKLIVCIFVDIISKHPSRALMCKSGSLGRLLVEATGTVGIHEILPSNLNVMHPVVYR
jgi:hypothetical protein